MKVEADMSVERPSKGNDHRDRVDIKYGLYRIVAGRRGQEHRAIAYTGDRQRFVVSGESVRDAVEQLQKCIDERAERLLRSRIEGVPVAEEYLDAFETLRQSFSEPRIRLMQLHRRRADHTAYFSDIGRLVGLTATAAESEYARLGNRVSSLLRFHPAPKWSNRTLAGILTLATPVGTRDIRSPFQLRPQVVAALQTFFDPRSIAGP